MPPDDADAVPDHPDDGAVTHHPDDGAEPAVVSIVGTVPTSPRPDHYDPMAAWAAGNTRRNR